MPDVTLNDGLQEVSASTSAKWVSLSLDGGPLADLLESIPPALLPVVEFSNTLVALSKELLETLLTFVVDINDPAAIALQIAIDAARAILDDLTGEASIYFLGVPVSRIDVAPVAKILYEEFPGEDFNYTELKDASDQLGSGGNYGFMASITETLRDKLDTFRPQFSQDAHVAGIAVVYGSDSYIEVLQLIAKLRSLFTSGPRPTATSEALSGGPPLPQPKFLSAELVNSPETTDVAETFNDRYLPSSISSAYAVRLTWEGLDGGAEQYLAGAGITVKVTRVTIWRSETPFHSNFPDFTGDAVLLGDVAYDEILGEFYDIGIGLGQTYHYAVAFVLTEIVDPNEPQWSDENNSDPPTVSVSASSSRARIDIPVDPSSMFPRGGVPPDWAMLPNPLALIPAVEQFARRMSDVLDSLESRLSTRQRELQNYIDSLQSDIDRYTAWYNGISSTVTQFLDAVDAVSWPEVYIGATAFAGQGGNDFMVNQIGEAIFNTGDTSAPPFPKGTECVGGFIVMTGAETAGALQPFKTLMKLFMGISIDAGDAVDHVSDIYQEAKEALGTATESVQEQICLNDSLSEVLACPGETEETHGFDAKMDPDDGDTSCTGA
jgi:hypothetical protein